MTDFLGQTAAGQSQKVQLFSTEEEKDTYITFRPSPRSEYRLLEASHTHGQGVLVLYWHKAASMAENIQTVGEIPRFFVLGTKNGEPDLGAWSKRMQDMLSSLPLANEWLPQLWKQLIEEEWAEPCKVFGSTAPVWMVSLKPEIWYQNIMSGIRSGSLLKLLPDPAGE